MLSSEAWAFPGAAGLPFEVSFVDAHGADRCERLAECRDVRFEDAQPVRLLPSFKGQRNFPCWWWSSTTLNATVTPFGQVLEPIDTRPTACRSAWLSRLLGDRSGVTWVRP